MGPLRSKSAHASECVVAALLQLLWAVSARVKIAIKSAHASTEIEQGQARRLSRSRYTAIRQTARIGSTWDSLEGKEWQGTDPGAGPLFHLSDLKNGTLHKRNFVGFDCHLKTLHKTWKSRWSRDSFLQTYAGIHYTPLGSGQCAVAALLQLLL